MLIILPKISVYQPCESVIMTSDIHMLGHLSHCHVFYVNVVYYIWVASKYTFKMRHHILRARRQCTHYIVKVNTY